MHPRSLMLYERLGLLVPERRGGQRRYSDSDLHWLGCIREINHVGGISLAGIRAFMRYLPCWALRDSAKLAASDISPARFEPVKALEKVQHALAGGAPESCKGCGCYREGMVKMAAFARRAAAGRSRSGSRR